MAKKAIEKATLQIQVDNGVNDSGKAVSKTYTISNVNPAAEADVVYNAGAKIGGLLNHEVQAIYATEKHLLTAGE